MTEEQKDLQKQEAPLSVRFMNKVVAQFSSGVGELALTNFQKRLAQNYFIAINGALEKAEAKRVAKNSWNSTKEKDKELVPVTWANINMEKLAQDVVACARIGLDPAQKNHISMMPFKNNATGKYDIVFIEGYRGLELKATKYGLFIPDEVVVEVVYETDKFKVIKKDASNSVESYQFDITQPFDRGKIVGGFYCHLFTDHPEKNKVIPMSMKDILKRKPTYASAEFWGGEKSVWKDGKKTTEETDGWYEKMVYKTIFRAAFNDITIDSQKIDDDFLRLSQMEDSIAEQRAQAEVDEFGNQGPLLDIKDDDASVVDAEFTEGEAEQQEQPEPTPPPEQTKQSGNGEARTAPF